MNVTRPGFLRLKEEENKIQPTLICASVLLSSCCYWLYYYYLLSSHEFGHMRKSWEACRALTMTLPPQMYPLQPMVALAWAARGAGARPCMQKLTVRSCEHFRNLDFQCCLTSISTEISNQNECIADSHSNYSHGCVLHSNWLAWGQIHEPRYSIPRRHLLPANNEIAKHRQENWFLFNTKWCSFIWRH